MLSLSSQAQAIGDVISGRDFFYGGTSAKWYLAYDSCCSDTAVFYIMGDTACSGYVENTLLGYHLDFSVIPGVPTILKIPHNIIRHNYSPNLIHSEGVFIHTDHDVFVYVQFLANIFKDAGPIEWVHCSYLISPLILQSPNYKIPIWPISYNAITRFNMQADMAYNPNMIYQGDPGIIYHITALEDSVHVFYFLQRYMYGENNDTILLSHKGESVDILLTEAIQFYFHTDCKRVVGQFNYFDANVVCTTNNTYGLIGDHEISNNNVVGDFPSAKTKKYLSGQNYLCKKLHNNRFDKGIALCDYYMNCVNNGNVVFTPWQFSGASAYIYNEFHNDYLGQLNYLFIQSNSEIFWSPCYDFFNPSKCLYTGNHLRYWGDTTVYVDVPFTLLRFAEPTMFDFNDGPIYKVNKTSRPGYLHYGYMTDPYGISQHASQSLASLQPAERMVQKWVYSTTRDNLKQGVVAVTGEISFHPCDSLYVDVQIYTHEDGIGSTYFNGQLIPATAFDTFPMTHGE